MTEPLQVPDSVERLFDQLMHRVTSRLSTTHSVGPSWNHPAFDDPANRCRLGDSTFLDRVSANIENYHGYDTAYAPRRFDHTSWSQSIYPDSEEEDDWDDEDREEEPDF